MKNDQVEVVSFYATKHQPTTLALSVAKAYKRKLLLFDIGKFADTESDVVFSDKGKVRGKKILLVWQFFFGSNRSINEQLLDLLIACSLLKGMGAKKLILLSPYLPYSRQDKNDPSSGLGLEVGNIRMLLGLLLCAGVNKIITCDLHEPTILKGSPITIEEISLTPIFADLISDFVDSVDEGSVVVSPDKGGVDRGKALAQSLDSQFAYLEKERVGKDKSKITKLHGDVKGKVVILLDDIIDTATTAAAAADFLVNKGAEVVVGFFSHGVLSNGAKEKIEKSKFSKVFISNTVPSALEVMSDKILFFSVDEFICE